MKGIDPRSPGYDEQNQDVSLEVKNAAVPRVEGSNPDSALNRKMQELATRRQGYIKLGKVDIDVNQQQGTGPSADTLKTAVRAKADQMNTERVKRVKEREAKERADREKETSL